MHKTFKIEKDIPFRRINFGNPGRPRIYPYQDMLAGDSFFIPFPSQEFAARVMTRNMVSASVTRNNNKYKGTRKFAQRTIKGGCRVWRVK